ncbi:PAS domain S-box protein [Aeromonas sp. 80P]
MDTTTLRFRYVSPAIQPLSGYDPTDVLTLPLRQLIPETSRKQLRAELSGSLAAWQRGDHGQTRCVIRTQLRHKQGHLVATETITTLHGNEQGQPDAILGVTRDITERAAREEMMRRLAFYDPLTNLPNRRLLQQRLKEVMEGRLPSSWPCCSSISTTSSRSTTPSATRPATCCSTWWPSGCATACGSGTWWHALAGTNS